MNELNPVLQLFIEWLKLTREERFEQGLPLTQQEFAIYNKVSAPQLSNWKKELDLQSAKPSEDRALFDHIIAEAKKPRCSPTLARLAWEITHPKDESIKGDDLSADDYINIGRQFKERQREEYRQSSGVCPVCGRPKALRNEPRLDTEPRDAEDREVATVGLSTRPD